MLIRDEYEEIDRTLRLYGHGDQATHVEDFEDRMAWPTEGPDLTNVIQLADWARMVNRGTANA